MIRTEDLIELMETEIAREYTHSDIDREYFGEIVARLKGYDKLLACPRPTSNAVDMRKLTDFCEKELKDLTDMGYLGVEEENYHKEIINHLRAYDELKEGIKKIIRDCRDSNVVDTK